MRYTGITGLLIASIATSAWSQSAPPPPDSHDATIAEVVVTGDQPGPGLWKATRDGRVLWIYGTVTPKPDGMRWRSKQVPEVLNDTQEVIDQQLQGTTWAVNFDIQPEMSGPFKSLRTMGIANKLRKAQKPPPPLLATVPPELYARFENLKSKYLPKNEEIELRRPRDAANWLYQAAIAARGLTARAMIHEETHRMARKRNVKVSEITLTMKFDMDTFADIIDEFNAIPPSAELICFEDTLALLESELPTITARANAWAIGDVNALRQMPTLTRESCDRIRWSAPRWADLDSRLDALWLDTIDAAVAKNRSTLVLLDMSELLQPQGLLAALVARGYEVQWP